MMADTALFHLLILAVPLLVIAGIFIKLARKSKPIRKIEFMQRAGDMYQDDY